MRAGDLRKRVVLQSRSTVQDTFSQPQQIWNDITTCWASISALTGRELVAAQAQNSSVTHVILVRYNAALFVNPIGAAAMRAVYGSRIFEILAVLNIDERNWEVEMMATEGLTHG